METCFVCQSTSDIRHHNLTVQYQCQRCGVFSIGLDVIQDFISPNSVLSEKQVANMSGWIRENQNILIDFNIFKKLLALKAPSVMDKAYKLLKWLDNKTKYYGNSVTINQTSNPELLFLYANCWAYDLIEVKYLFTCLKKIGYIVFNDNGGESTASISPEGYNYLENYYVNQESNIGFCAMWFNPKMDPAWEESIEPGIRLAGYEPKRIDKHPHNEGVVDEIIALVRRSKFIISDLTGHRRGVYFEAGFAKGLGIEVIFTCQREALKKLHFDLKHFNFLLWEPNNYVEFRENLRFRIEQTIGRGKNFT